jgi:hypothetical protein
MKYHRELQNINTEEKAYLLGLFYSDGNVSKNQHHSRLTLKDEILIKTLHEKFTFFNFYKIRNIYYELHSGINLVRKDLIDNGCLPDKSYSNKNNIKIPNVGNLINHFIRGYFDGDGGCTLRKPKNKVQKRVYIYSASLNLLKEIDKILVNYNIKCSITRTSNTVYKLTILVNSYKLFYDFIYKNATIFMFRKEKLFNEILKTKFFVQKGAPNCKFCDSQNTVFNGNNYYKNNIRPRVLCKDCKRNFITAPVNSNINSGVDELLES